jgi:hypothetical protein
VLAAPTVAIAVRFRKLRRDLAGVLQEFGFINTELNCQASGLASAEWNRQAVVAL